MEDTRHYAFGSESAIVDRSTSPPSYIFTFPFTSAPSASAIYQTIATESFHCINSFYTVVAGFNDTIAVNMTLVHIPEGFYTSTSFCTAVQTLLRTVIGPNATVTYSSTTGRVTVQSNDSYNFTIFSAPLTTAGDLLGMIPNKTYSGFASYTFERFLDLMPVKRVLIASNLPTKNMDLGRNQWFLGSFSVTAPPLQMIDWDMKTFESIVEWNTSVSQLRLQFFDQSGRGLELNSHFCIVIEHTIYHRESLIPPPINFYEFLSSIPALTLEQTDQPQETIDADS